MYARPSGPWRFLPLTLLLLGGVVTHSADARVSAPGQVHRVRMKGLKYVPEQLVVHRGDTVVWVNEDKEPHTVTAVGSGGPPQFDSGTIQPKASWRYVAKEKGRFRYLCTLHPGMRGTLTVR